jgi:hypothetical protein
MGLFKKKGETASEKIPKLPEMPKLPELPDLKNPIAPQKEILPQLPSFPSNSLGDKFSQNSIKSAVSGEEGDMEEVDDIEESQMMPKPPIKQPIQTPQTIPTKSKQPIFIRLDKFKESLEVFNNTKEKVMEIESLLKEIKTTKEQEQAELTSWENEIQTIKKQIEKVDKDIFSKV